MSIMRVNPDRRNVIVHKPEDQAVAVRLRSTIIKLIFTISHFHYFLLIFHYFSTAGSGNHELT